MRVRRGHPGTVLWAALLAIVPAVALPQGSSAVPQAEQLDVATLKPQYAHRVFATMRAFGGGGFEILNGDTLAIEGTIPAVRGVLALGPAGHAFYVCETIWTLGNRGTRQDMVSVYDARALSLTAEVQIPGRLLVGTRTHNCDISASGKFLFVYNMQPASSVIVVDLKRRRVASVIETPGCAGAFPWHDDGFAALCGDGSLATGVLSADGRSKALAHSGKFFDPDNDPIFEESVVDRDTGKAFFLSYTGLVYPAQLGEQPTIGRPWSLQAAAGLPAAGTGPQELAWRPGGVHMLAWHKATNRLYVLMHVGTHWTQRLPGTELWVVDASAHKVLKRLQMPAPMDGIAISQDATPLLYAATHGGDLYTLDPDTGQQKVKKTVRAGSVAWVPGF